MKIAHVLALIALLAVPSVADAATVTTEPGARNLLRQSIQNQGALHKGTEYLQTFTLTAADGDTVVFSVYHPSCFERCIVRVTPSTAITRPASISDGAYPGQSLVLSVVNGNEFVIPTTLSNVDFGTGGSVLVREGMSAELVWDGTDWRTVSGALASNGLPGQVIWQTDFLGDLYPGELLAGVGSGTGNAVAQSAGQGGRLEIKTSSADAADSANASSIGLGALDYRADQGGLVMEARIQIDAITAVGVFVGFTDTLTSTVEMPIFMVAADIDSTATDAAGLLFDTDATTDQWTCGGVKADVDTTPVLSGTAPSAATYYTVRVEISAAGAVRCYVDGVAVGASTSNAITVTAPVLPVILANNRSAAVRNVLVDYMYVAANR